MGASFRMARAMAMLALASPDKATLFADHEAIALGLLRAMKSCASAYAGRVLDFGQRCTRPIDGDVVANGSVEEAGVLENDGDLLAHGRERHVCDIVTVDHLTRPASGLRSRMSSDAVVDLPDPVGPTRAMVWPGWACRVRLNTPCSVPGKR